MRLSSWVSLAVAATTVSATYGNKCTRKDKLDVRKEWRDSTDAEKRKYIAAIKVGTFCFLLAFPWLIVRLVPRKPPARVELLSADGRYAGPAPSEYLCVKV
jgi:hypothetical protein